MAEPIYLLKWLNTFLTEERHVQVLEQLADGQVLLKSMHRIFPDLLARYDVADGSEPWLVLWRHLEVFCGCSLRESISLDLLQQGDKEHIARVLVLLLCSAVDHEPNEEVIDKIFSLDNEVQHHIKFFIEHALSEVNSDAIATGRFTSGAGEDLRMLDGEDAPEEDEEEKASFSLPAPPSPPSAAYASRVGMGSSPVTTPSLFRRPSKCPHPTPRKYLESPAAVHWLASPAVRSSTQPLQWDPKEEVYRLQHRVRVLEKSLDSQKQLAHDYFQEVCLKSSVCEEMEARCVKAEGQLRQLQAIPDLQDEIDYTRQELEKANSSLEKSKIQTEELQAKLHEAHRACKCTEQSAIIVELKQRVDQLTGTVCSMSMEEQKAGLKLHTLAIELDGKQGQISTLIESNKELSQTVEDMGRELDEVKARMRADLESRDEREQALHRDQGLRVNSLQNTLATAEEALAALGAEKAALHEQITESSQALEDSQKRCQALELEKAGLELLAEKERAAMQSRIQDQEEVNDRLSRELSDKSLEVEHLELFNQSLVSELEAHKRRTTTLLQDQTNVSEALRDSQVKYQQLEETNSSLQSRLEELQTELSSLQEEKSAVQSDKVSMDQLVGQMRRELADYKGKMMGDMERRAQSLQDQVDRVRRQLQQAGMERGRQKEYIAKLEADRAQLGNEFETENQQLHAELDKARKLLKKEQYNRAKLSAENKSFETQLSYTSQKLREAEKSKQQQQQQSLPSPLRQSSRLRTSYRPLTASSSRRPLTVASSSSAISVTSYEPRTSEEEFYHQLQSEFDNQPDNSGAFLEVLSDEDEGEDSLRLSDLEPMANNSTARTLVGPSQSSSRSSSGTRQSAMSGSLAAIREAVEEEVSGEMEEEVDPKMRVNELQKRNSKQLPHLKSSYPIEMQVQPDSPSISDNLLKHGGAGHRGRERKHPDSRLAAHTTTTATKGISFEVDLNFLPLADPPLLETRKRSTSYRKQSEEQPVDVLCRSPLPNRRKTSAPPTPETTDTSKFAKSYNPHQARRATMAPSGLGLRNFLDKKPGEVKKEEHSKAFEVAFSPPRGKVKTSMPKRLQENINKTRSVSSKSMSSKPTAVATKTQSQSSSSERAPIRSLRRGVTQKIRNK